MHDGRERLHGDWSDEWRLVPIPCRGDEQIWYRSYIRAVEFGRAGRAPRETDDPRSSASRNHQCRHHVLGAEW